MTEPSTPRPMPGPPRTGPRPGEAHSAAECVTGEPGPSTGPSTDPFADLAERPIAEHVAVFEAEHARLERELATIDQL